MVATISALVVALISSVCFSAAEEDFSMFRDAPIQIIAPDGSHSRLVILEENVRVLESITEQVAVVSVLGRLHAGKSFLVNQLLGRTAGFNLGSSVEPCTQGIWMWARPMVRTIEGKPTAVVVLDTEGFFGRNASDEYDAKIFSLAAMLSSYMIVTTKQTIDFADLEYLELLVRRTELFGLRLEAQPNPASPDRDILNPKAPHFTIPPLLWVVNDFFLSVGGQTPTQWLRGLLQAYRDDQDATVSAQVDILDTFPSVECRTLPLPHYRSSILRHLDKARQEDLLDEYNRDLDALRALVFSSVPPKRFAGAPLTGPELATILRVLVSAANGGQYPVLRSQWANFLSGQQQQAYADAVRMFKDAVKVLVGNDTLSEDEFEARETTALGAALGFYRRALFNIRSLYETHLLELQDEVKEEAARYMEAHRRAIERAAQALRQELQGACIDGIGELAKPAPSRLLKADAEALAQNAVHEFDRRMRVHMKYAACKDVLADLKVALSHAIGRLMAENGDLIKKRLSDSSAHAVSHAEERLAATVTPDTPLSTAAFDHLRRDVMASSLQALTTAAAGFVNEESFVTFQSGAKERVKELLEAAEIRNLEWVELKCAATAKAVENLMRTATVGTPCTDYDDMRKAMGVEVDHQLASYSHKLGDLAAAPTCSNIRKQLLGKLVEISREAEERNIGECKVLVRECIRRTKAHLRTLKHSYTWRRGLFQSRCRDELLQCFQGEASNLSFRMRTLMADSFVTEDMAADAKDLWDEKTLVVTLFAVGVLSLTFLSFRGGAPRR